MARRDISEEVKRAVVRDYNDNMSVVELAAKYNVADSSIYRWATMPEYNDGPAADAIAAINGEIAAELIEPDLPNPNHDRTFEVTIKVSGDYLERLVTDPHIAIEKIERKTY